jgi:hypothetical protein
MNEIEFKQLNMLFRSKVIREMTIEDLEVWKGYDKIYPIYVRFPEILEFNKGLFCYRKDAIRDCRKLLINVDKYIKNIIGYPEKGYRDKRIQEYLSKEKIRLEQHLIKLREMRNKRKELK